MGLLSDIFDPGRDQREGAVALANESIFQGGTSTGPGGIESGIGFDDSGAARLHGSLGQFDPFLQSLFGAAGIGFGQAQGGIPSFLQPQAQGLGQVFQSALGISQADPFALGAETTERFRAAALPQQQQAAASQLSNLFAKGQLGTTGGAQQAQALVQAQQQQDLGFQQAGFEAGRGIQQDALTRLFGSQAGLGNIFGQAMQQQELGFQQGLQGVAGASSLAQLPLIFQQAIMNAGQLRSESGLSAAGIGLNAAAQTPSVLQEAVGAAAGIRDLFRPTV
jgi:hypothetical protein